MTVRAQSYEASSAISAAQTRLLSCFEEAKNAESAGANISNLTITLNEAGLFLSNAEAAYANNDFSSAETLALMSQKSLNNFESMADSLRVNAIASANWNFLVNIVGSFFGAIGVIAGSAFLWWFLKKYQLSEIKK